MHYVLLIFPSICGFCLAFAFLVVPVSPENLGLSAWTFRPLYTLGYHKALAFHMLHLLLDTASFLPFLFHRNATVFTVLRASKAIALPAGFAIRTFFLCGGFLCH